MAIEDPNLKGSLGDRWLFAVTPHPGESIFSLLARQAHESSITVAAIAKGLGFSRRVDQVDWDINPPEAVMEMLAARLGVEKRKLDSHLLVQGLANILPAHTMELVIKHSSRPRHATWVLPVAWNGFKDPYGNRASGVPYCAACMMEGGESWFPTINRMSFMVGCRKHRILLRDDCPRCGIPFSPGTTLSSPQWPFGSRQRFCIRCPPMEAIPTEWPNTLKLAEGLPESIHLLQESMILATEGMPVEVPQIGYLSPQKFMAGFRYANTLASFLLDHGLEAEDQREHRFSTLSPLLFRSKGQGSFEFCTLQERKRRMAWMAWVFERPLDRWHLVMELRGLPRCLGRSSKHPWEGIDEGGVAFKFSDWHKMAHQRAVDGEFEADRRFHAIVNALGVEDRLVQSLLGGMPNRQFAYWKARPTQRLPSHCKHRMDHFLRIWDGLESLLGDPAATRSWFNQPNLHSRFDGGTPLQKLVNDPSGEELEFLSMWIGQAKGRDSIRSAGDPDGERLRTL